LSAFHHKPYSLAAAVALPKSYYDQPTEEIPCSFQCFLDMEEIIIFRSGDTTTRGMLDSIEASSLI
jgi:hypothetical protein